MFFHTCTCSVYLYLGVWGINIQTHLCPESFLNLPCMCVPARWYCWPPERTQSSNHWQTSWPRGWTARWCRWEKNRGMICILWWRRGSCIGRTWRTWVKLFNISAFLSRWQCEYTQLWLICEVFFFHLFQATTNQTSMSWTWQVWARYHVTLPCSLSRRQSTRVTVKVEKEQWESLLNTYSFKNKKQNPRQSWTALTTAAFKFQMC